STNWKRCSKPSGTVCATRRQTQRHRHLRNLADYFDLRRIFIGFGVIERRGMRLHNQVIFAQGAPPAQVAVAVLKKVDRAFEFVSPTRTYDLSARFVNDYQSAGRDERKHGPILCSNQAVAVISKIDVIEQHQGQLTPALDQTA